LGSILNFNIIKYFNDLGIRGVQPNNLYTASALNNGIPLEQVKASLNSALHVVFITLIFVVVVSTAVSFLLPAGLKEERGRPKYIEGL